MSNILNQIIATKKQEVEVRRSGCPIAMLEQSMYFNRKTYSFKSFLADPEKSGIIAEFKRQSPSRGVINDKVLLADVVKGYEQAGASAVSVLTDKKYFGGESKDLTEARTSIQIPVLRKDFIIDEYQIVEAKSIGADVILLIAAALEPERLKELAAFAKFIGLEVLMEVHDEDELQVNLHDEVDVIGVNNRNLKDFSQTIETSIRLANLIPPRYPKISESGISRPETIIELKEKGYTGFLIGETFMRFADPGAALQKLVADVKHLEGKLK